MERVRTDFGDMNRRAGELLRRVNRFADGPMTRKKMLLLVLIVVFLILYVGPFLMNVFYPSDSDSSQNICHKNFLTSFESAFREYDAYLRQETSASLKSLKHNYVPYVGNGLLGLILEHDSYLNIKHGRTLSLPLYYRPLYIIKEFDIKEFTVADYKNGIVNRFQCSKTGLHASYQYYAHRTIPSLFVQEILINNPTSKDKTLHFLIPKVGHNWQTAVQQVVKLHQGVDTKEYEVITGMIQIPDSEMVIAAAVVCRKMSDTLVVEARSSLDLLILTTVKYSNPLAPENYAKYKDIVEKEALEEMEKVIGLTTDRSAIQRLRENHSRVWQGLWFTGFYISDSKATGIINGDRINATIYAILSQVRSFEHEEHIKPKMKQEILKNLTYSEGCYGGHSTLDAFNLWKPLNSLANLNAVASVWLLTLEKQGCHNLLKAGASGVNQAMILSFGSLRFSNQHLEYNIHPSKLHRDFLFRRINYGNMTHVNISIIVQEDNKAAIFVALDRSDKSYYACDAGCLDSPVQLAPYRKYFPVKLTDPLTAILYITADKQHMEDLRHAIHVQEVVEAPAHENHIIALHKHGHSWGGLNPLFWISIILLIVVFHLFLCRIIMNEFCDNGVNYRRLYNKP